MDIETYQNTDDVLSLMNIAEKRYGKHTHLSQSKTPANLQQNKGNPRYAKTSKKP